MTNAQIIRQFVAENNTEEVLALAEELGLSLITANRDNSTTYNHGRTEANLRTARFRAIPC